jgi:ribosome-associated protein
MDIRKLQRTIVDALEDVKAQDIQVFNTEALTSLFDRVIVASGSSNRQTRSLAASVRDQVRAAGGTVKNPEGESSGEWVLVDCGDAVVHIMQPVIRAYYKLEDIWGGKTVHLKAKQDALAIATASSAARRASVSPAKAGAAPPKRAAPAKRPASKRPAAGSTQTASGAARKPPAKTSAKRNAWPGKARADDDFGVADMVPAKPRAKTTANRLATSTTKPGRSTGNSGAKPRASTKTIIVAVPAPRKRAASTSTAGTTTRSVSKPAAPRRAPAKKSSS